MISSQQAFCSALNPLRIDVAIGEFPVHDHGHEYDMVQIAILPYFPVSRTFFTMVEFSSAAKIFLKNCIDYRSAGPIVLIESYIVSRVHHEILKHDNFCLKISKSLQIFLVHF